MSRPMTVAERLWRRVAIAGPDDCWLWTGHTTGYGYGSISVGPRGPGWQKRVHRVAYELTKGPIPDGLQIDHLCRVRTCVNPAHLEAVAARTNALRSSGIAAANARKTHCAGGHPFVGDNLYCVNGERRCRACNRMNQRNYQMRRAETARQARRILPSP